MFQNRTIDWMENQQNQAPGSYVCSRCGTVLFAAAQKFDSKTGFPSFWAHVEQNVRLQELDTYGRDRIQLVCNSCHLHLGHLFPDQRTPSEVRYCINASSIHLQNNP